jgi:MYXO-CTERM domain-containing protein
MAIVLGPACRAADITIGNPLSGELNAFPFSGVYQDGFGADRYQQVYLSSQFGGAPLSIDAITFYTGSFGGPNADGTYVMSLSTTSAPVDGLDPNMANNVGPDNQTFFNGALPPFVLNSTITYTLATPFTYNPAGGNLLLDIQISGVTNDSSAPYVAQNGDFGGLSSRMVNGGAGGTTGYGLVTTFSVGPVSSVPEPGTMSMAAMGAGAVFGLAWRRRRRY